MTTFNGQRMFRPRGKLQDHPSQDWEAYARKAIVGGGRIVQSKSGDYHIISPSDAHWGTFRAQQGIFEGGTLQKVQDGAELRDITEYFQ